jgi:hypothetical protein
MDVQMTAALAAKLLRLQRQREAEKQRRRDKARLAIERHSCTQHERHRKAALQAIEYYFLYANSEERLSWVLSLIEFAPPEMFWPALMDAWSGGDDTWHARSRLLQVLRAMPPAASFFSPAQRALFDPLPAQVKVFRGCSRPRLHGIAWTTDRTVAEGFARGHCGIRVPEPVVASAVIPKKYIFFVTDDRSEREVVLNPRRLQNLKIEPYTATVSQAS